MIFIFGLLFPAWALAQNANGLIYLRRGSETLKGFTLAASGQILGSPGAKLLTQLPPNIMEHHPRLLGISDYDQDGKLEVFISWSEIQVSEEWLQHIQIYRKDTALKSALVGDFQMEGGEGWIEFPPTKAAGKLAVAAIPGGAKWGTYYVIFAGAKAPLKLGEAAGLALADFDGDGTYEWILLQWRGTDLRCSYGFFSMGSSADVFRLHSRVMTRLWPLPDWALMDGFTEDEIRRLDAEQRYGHRLPPPPSLIPGGGPNTAKPIPWGKTFVVENKFYDMDDEGRPEIVAITDEVTRGEPRLRVSVYRDTGLHFDLVASLRMSPPLLPISFLGIRRLQDRKQLVLRLADSARCNDEQHKEEKGVTIAAGIDFKEGGLVRSWMNDQIDFTLRGIVKDIDGDGEEEMVFSSEGMNQYFPPGTATRKPLLLKGIGNFLPYTSPQKR